MEVVHSGFQITDRSGIAEARRRAQEIATGLGFSEEGSSRVAIVVTELATNLWRHGNGGWCFLGPSGLPPSVGVHGRPPVDIVLADAGPGLSDPSRALEDGYTTGSTPGTGLGAVVRLSNEFQLYTRAGEGLVCLARVSDRPATGVRRGEPIRFCALGAPIRGEQISGDSAAARSNGHLVSFLLADGLGHGHDAALAAGEAVRIFHGHAGSPIEQIKQLHSALRPTRGAAVAVVEIDLALSSIRYSGIGNIESVILSPDGSTRLASMNGTAGHIAPSLREFTYPAPPESLVVMHSDGVSTRWNLERYPGLRQKDPAVIAAVLFRDFGRGRDDATVLVARLPPAQWNASRGPL